MDFPLWTVAPFLILLLCIAIAPLAVPKFWTSNSNKLLVSLGLSIPVFAIAVPYAPHLVIEAITEYFSFVILLGALFIISGGIFIKGEFPGTPLVNTILLVIGALLANLIGTTGASMLLIRPFLRANHARQHQAHLVVFFIFVVSNIGGLLTPLGDPPLFLGFLRGVPFQWTLTLFPVWLTTLVIVLIAFNLYDQYVFYKDDVAVHGALAEKVLPRRKLEIRGKRNFICLFGVLAAAIFSGFFSWPRGIQELLMIVMAIVSWYTTPKHVHEANHFHLHPISEVAVLFAGIFITMIPALQILNLHAPQLGIQTPWQYFWLTGILSSFLDNAPTYLTFTSVASGVVGGTSENLKLLLESDAGRAMLRAISCGAVFMGANSYIGNGPNFMVKSIAEHHKVRMPTFAGYLLYSGAVLIPVFIVVTLIFFR